MQVRGRRGCSPQGLVASIAPGEIEVCSIDRIRNTIPGSPVARLQRVDRKWLGRAAIVYRVRLIRWNRLLLFQAA